MIRQMLKLIWRRKRSNGFLVTEMLLTFFVLYGVLTLGLNVWNTYKIPAGFAVDNVLNIEAHRVVEEVDPFERAIVFSQLAQALKDIREVNDVGATRWALYGHFQSISSLSKDEKKFKNTNFAYLSDSCFAIMDMDVVQGRWFGPSDDNGGEVRPVVLNEKLSREIFGAEDPIGKIVDNNLNVVGVVSDYRLYGPLDEPRNLVIERVSIDIPDNPQSPSAPHTGEVLLVKLNAQITAELNARIFEVLQAVAPDWTFNITPGEDLRTARIKGDAIPYLAAGFAAVALVGMVLLGMFGVLWQNIVGRTREFGLRRAKGAAIGNIFTQVIGEMCIVVTLGLIPGVLIIGQLLLMDALGNIPTYVHIAAVVLASALIYVMVILASLYPGYMATRINPAQALHYE